MCAALLPLTACAGTSSSVSPAPAAMTTAPSLPPVSTPTPTPSPTPTFDKAAASIDDPASLWVVVDKRRPLNPADYAPADLVDLDVPHTWQPRLRKEAADAVVAMFAAAQTEAGLTLASNSAYRSYDSQVDVYNDDLNAHGQAFADTDTARPGYSEHQTGLAIDIGADSGYCSLDPCFAGTPEGQWLAANAWRFGFLLRYPQGLDQVTGYTFEPWHYRYIGVPLATELHSTGVPTLEQFFGLPNAPGYP
jgi:D-alanyl-D-alanine carboxypeptidase